MTKVDEIGEIYDFAKDRLVEYSKDINSFTTSQKNKWKRLGKIDLLQELLHFIKELDKK